jgi:hypothetical protein
MKVNHRAQVAAVAFLCVGIGGFAAAAPLATAGTDAVPPGSTLSVSVPGQPVQGQVMTIVATGSNGATDPPINYGLYLFLVDPTKYTSTCAVSEPTEEADAANNPDAIRQLNFASYNEGTGGSFSLKVPFTPAGYGKLTICAYSTYGTDDAAWATTSATVSPASSSSTTGTTTSPEPSSKPNRPHIAVLPTVTRHGNRLTCTRGTWSGKPTSYTYRWRVDGQIRSDKKSSLTVAAGAKGSAVCTVTARNKLGSGSASSRSAKL